MTGTSNKGFKVYSPRFPLGCDPELFLERAGAVIGSEEAIPETGIVDSYNGKIVQDGVQVELNPRPSSCRQTLAYEIAAAFTTLKAHLQKMENVKISFASVIEMDKGQMDKLSEKSKRLGCMPSLNSYDKAASISVDPATYMKRSAAGHLHLAIGGMKANKDPDRMAQMLDIIVGNTSVLMDRDPMAAERRKVYGRAGEYRLPKHGLEYRTPSNFWLRSYSLMSGVFSLARLAVGVMEFTQSFHAEPLYPGYQNPYLAGYHAFDAESELLKRVDVEKVRKAINENDVELAKENYQGVRDFISEFVLTGDAGLVPSRLKPFDYFIHMIDQQGLWYWFPDDPMEHWTNAPVTIHPGFESFMDGIVTRRMADDVEWMAANK